MSETEEQKQRTIREFQAVWEADSKEQQDRIWLLLDEQMSALLDAYMLLYHLDLEQAITRLMVDVEEKAKNI